MQLLLKYGTEVMGDGYELQVKCCQVMCVETASCSLCAPCAEGCPPAGCSAPGVDDLKSGAALPASLTAAGANVITHTDAHCRYENLRSGAPADKLKFT